MSAPPCRHPYAAEPVAGCAYCRVRGLAFHRDRWTNATREVPSPVRVKHCPKRNRWDWAVVRDGQTLASGTAKTEAEARDEATAADPAPGFGILLTGGIGDVFAVESMMTDDERARLEAVYYACPASGIIRDVWAKLPNFPRLTSHVLMNTGRQVFRNVREVTIHGYTVPEGTQDWNIGAIFSQRRACTGSSFVKHKLADARPVPGPYVVIQPVSSWGRWRKRPFKPADWHAVRAFLEGRGLYGVILNQHGSPLPNWPCLIGWQGITTLAESIELLKASQGYLGIDSCLSVLAAKLFPASRLAVKGTRKHVYDCAWAYYAPHTTFPFLKPNLSPPPWD
jgi:hypothetical protein